MATLDEIFAAMPDEAAGGTHELLAIDADTREIYVPDSEKLFGVEHDGNAETKYFQCPRYVGKGIDLAACFLRVNFQNANGDRDGYLVKDTTVNGEHIYFSWELWPKVTQYKGIVQFVLCASLPGSTKTADWHTTLAQGDVLEGLEPDAEAVAAASSDLIAQLLATVQAQEANVEAVGAEQVQTVHAAAKAAQEAAVAEVEAKKQNALAEIPDDYTAMGQQVDKLNRSTAGAILCRAEGTAIQVANASDHQLPGLRIFGRSTQDGTPTPDNPVEIISTPAPVVRVCSKNLFDIDTMLGEYATITNGVVKASHTKSAANIPVTPGQKYTVSAYVYGPEDNGGALALSVQDGKEKGYTTMDEALGFVVGVKATPTLAIITFTAVSDYVSISANASILDNIMVSLGETAVDFEPYSGGVMQTVNNLPGIPVASGGNYTDADGQQWICDEVDLGRGVYVQRVGALRFDGSNSNWWMYVATYGEALRFDYMQSNIKPKSLLISDRFRQITISTPDAEGINSHGSQPYILLQISASRLASANVAGLMDYFAANPSNVIYQLSEPVETPISEAELAAFAALHSVKPTTTILNDSGAHMAVEYVADTKLYIDGKLAELVAAMNA